MGPEVYWGANPKVIVKYDFDFANIDWTFIHSEDVARSGEGASATQATERQSRQTTLFASKQFSDAWKLEVGGIMSATEKVDDIYTRVDSADNVFLDEIEFEDTLGIKAKLSFPLFGAQSYVSAHHAGLVADGGQVHKTFGVFDPSRLPYSGLGNKQEYEAGVIMNFGNLMVYPRIMYRDNLVHANPFIAPSIVPGGVLRPGTAPRDRDNDPFAVLGNREARSAEVYFTWDPTGATQFYSWDNDWREDARFAFDFGGSYTEYPTPTDANLFFLEQLGINASFGQGLPAEDVWSVSSRMVFNPKPGRKYITRLVRGFEQSTGDPNGGTRDHWQFHWKTIWGGKHTFSGYYMKDAWGPYDFYRQFNVTYPEQVKLDYSVLLGGNAGAFKSAQSENEAARIGIRALYRSGDENSDLDPILDGDHIFMTVLYFTYQF